MTDQQTQLTVRLPDEPDSAARARELVDHVQGEPSWRVEDARLLLSELVTLSLHEGVGYIEVRLSTDNEHLRLEAGAPVERPPRRHLTPANALARDVVAEISDRWGEDTRSVWCELDGSWQIAV